MLQAGCSSTLRTSDEGKNTAAVPSKRASLEDALWLTVVVYDSAVWMASFTPVTVMVCALFQLPEVNVRGMLVLTVRYALDAVAVTCGVRQRDRATRTR